MTDELPMVYSSCAFIYSLKLVGEGGVPPKSWLELTSHIQIEGEKERSDKSLVGLLIIYSFLFSALYLTFPFPIIHQVEPKLWYYNDDFYHHRPQVLYGIMIVIMIYLGLLPILKTKDPVSIKLFLSGVIIFLIAFILWNIGTINKKKNLLLYFFFYR